MAITRQSQVNTKTADIVRGGWTRKCSKGFLALSGLCTVDYRLKVKPLKNINIINKLKVGGGGFCRNRLRDVIANLDLKKRFRTQYLFYIVAKSSFNLSRSIFLSLLSKKYQTTLI